MRKFIFAVLAVLSISLVAQGYDWEAQRGHSQRFFVNLGGSAPTAGQLSTNFVNAGDIVVDSFNSSVYIIANPNGGRYVKVASNGVVSVTGGASNAGQQFLASLTTNGAGVVTAYSYKTNVITSGVVITAP